MNFRRNPLLMSKLMPMSKLNSCRLAIFFAVCLFPASLFAQDTGSPEPPTHSATRPNIVLIMCDDMGWSDIGCYGGEVQTPNLDRLAAEGMRFTQFYNNGKCTTTRASILTGLYPRREKKDQLLRKDMLTIGEAMKLAGYQTSLSGKWHLGSKRESHPYYRGFDEFYGLLDGCCNCFEPTKRDPPYKGGRVRKFAHNDQAITSFPEDFYTTDAFTDHAIECIEKFSKARKPFLAHLTYTAPHYPLHAKPADIAKYRGKYREIGGWEKLRSQRFARLKELGIAQDNWKLSGTDENAYDWETANHDHEDLRMAVYAAMIDSMDQNIGRILDTLEKENVLDNTLILFLSDNGGCAEEPGGRDPKIIPGPKEFYAAVGPAWGWAQNAPFRKHKSNTCEGGILTPCIAWWPGKIKAGQLTRQPAHIIDIMPTFLELATAEYPGEFQGNQILPVEGKSIQPILLGQQRQPHAQMAWEWGRNRAIREGDWKAVWQYKGKQKKGHWALYDLASDRCETKDLAKEHSQLTLRLAKDWFQWAKKTGLKVNKK